MISISNPRKSATVFWLLTLCAVLFVQSGCKKSNGSNAKNGNGQKVVDVDESNKSKAGKKSKVKLDLKGLPKIGDESDFSPNLSFTEIQKDAGIDFVYQNGQQGFSMMVETTGGGSAWLDYDLDGCHDIIFCQGGDPTKVALPSQPLDVLYRQIDDGKFTPFHSEIGISDHNYSQGVSAGDFDGDGFDDIYVTNCGKNSLWRNLGDGTFEEITIDAGVGGGEVWSSTSAWADIDLDGDLDLYVCNYVQYDRFNPYPCVDDKRRPAICHPKHVDAWPDYLYINNGDGTFTDEAHERGVFGEGNKGLGVAVADFNKDGFPDIYVANDTTANFLFVNDGKARFKEVAGLLGCDVDRSGSFQASMGLGIFDYDENGLLDIFLTHYTDESNTLYKNSGELGYQDVSAIVQLYSNTLPWLGFGTIMADFNNDSRAEIFIAQGHVNNTVHFLGEQKMPAALYSFDGDIFHELTAKAGKYFSRKFVGRGVAACDFDRDGDWDLVVNHQNDPASLLRNDSETGHFIKLRFVGTESNRTGYGTQVKVRFEDRELYHELVAGTSYVSSSEPVLIFGLGDYSGKCDLEIKWPNGKTRTMKDVKVDQSLVLVEGA